jgi:hypothetical protein
MKKAAFLGAIVAGLASAAASAGATAADFRVCKSTYALCTRAKCTAELGNAKAATCACEVRTGYSVGSTPCQEPKQTNAGEQIRSRYYPIKSYAHCANNRPWANCYDKECVVAKDDPSKAACTCSVKENEGDYVRVTGSYSVETCTIGLWSSATVSQLEEVTDFLKGQKDLKPFPLEVLNADTLGSMTPSSAR